MMRHTPARVQAATRSRLALEVALAARADNLLGDLALVEQQQRGDGADAVLRGERLLLVNVDLADFHLAVVFVGELVEQRRDHFARTAPFGPEIHEHGRWRLQDLLRKILLCKRDDEWRGHNKNKIRPV